MKALPVYTKILPVLADTDRLWIACSGGIDSMFAAMYFIRTRKIGLAYFNHGSPYADAAERYVERKARKMGVLFHKGGIDGKVKAPDQSLEEFWRIERYAYLNTIGPAVVTGHHLDDAIETWVWSSCHGKPTLPHLNINNIYRPFLGCKKAAMKEQLVRHGFDWFDDPSNDDTNFTRNHIRTNVMPMLYKVNPGLDTVIQKKIEERVTIQVLQNSK